MTNFPFESQRALFPILARKAQLSSCSQSALSTPVTDAIASYMASWSEKGMDWGGWAGVLDQAKAGFPRLIGADADDVAAMSCVSDLASSVDNCLAFDAGRNGIVLDEVDFPSLGHAWLAQQSVSTPRGRRPRARAQFFWNTSANMGTSSLLPNSLRWLSS